MKEFFVLKLEVFRKEKGHNYMLYIYQISDSKERQKTF